MTKKFLNCQIQKCYYKNRENKNEVIYSKKCLILICSCGYSKKFKISEMSKITYKAELHQKLHMVRREIEEKK